MDYTVGIAAISGRVSLCIVQSLLRRSPDVTIKGYCRQPSNLPQQAKDHPRIHVTQGQYDDVDGLRSFVKGCDIVICGYLADNNSMVDLQKLLIDVCVEEKVPRYMASDWTIELTALEHNEYRKKEPMLQIIDYLEKVDIKPVHILNGIFVDTLFSDFHYFWDPREKKVRYYGTGDEVWEMSTYESTAEYTAAVALDPDAHGFLRFLGDRRTTHEMVSDLEEVYGFKPSTANLGDLDFLYKRAHRNGEQNVVQAGAWLMQTGKIHLRGLDNGRYPDIKAETLRDYFRKYPVDKIDTVVERVGYEWNSGEKL